MLEPRQRRKHERAVMKHLQRVAQALMQMLQKQPFDRLFLAGTEEVVDMLRDILPRPLRARYAESLRLPVSARESEVLAATIEASERHERAVEVETVERLIDRAGAHTAVLGLEETLAAIFDGRVDMLVMSSDLNGEVAVCGNCGRLTTSKSTCPACGSQIEKVVDLRERIVSEVLDQSGRIEIVEGPAAEMLGRHGGVGAFLRF
jgi:peptide subunit release factor 1 (eRF1)